MQEYPQNEAQRQEFEDRTGHSAVVRAYEETGTFDKLVHDLPGRPPFMLDRDIAAVYGVETRVLMQQVRRNEDHFHVDMVFQLTENELEKMVSQNVIPSKQIFGGHLPWGFTRLGSNHVAHFLKSKQAIERSIQISRAFVHFEDLHQKGLLATNLLIPKEIVEEWSKRLVDFEVQDALERSTKLDKKTYQKMLRYRKMGLSQSDTATLLGLNRSTVHHYERLGRRFDLQVIQGGKRSQPVFDSRKRGKSN